MNYKLDRLCNKDISKYIPFAIPCDSEKDLGSDINENTRISQEQHHAMHVLTFLYFLVYRTLNGERIRRRIIGRIIHHLMDLREFLEDGALNDQANILLGSVQKEYDNSLSYIVSRIHKGIRIVARAFDHDKKEQFISTVSTILIKCSEHEHNPKICMYPWLLENQDRILKFAQHYGREHIFNKLIPILKPGTAKTFKEEIA